MKRRLITALIVVGALSLTACQEDVAMEELVENIELNEAMDPDNSDDPPGGGNN